MPYRQRHCTAEFVFHVFNRAVQDLVLFEQPSDYEAFLRVVREAAERYPVRVLAFAVMPNHWHLVLWPSEDNGLSHFMRWLTATHALRWRTARGSVGRGALYQSRFKAIPVQRDIHFLRLCLYVERNPMRARLVERAEQWPWSSASMGDIDDENRPPLSEWPLPKPVNWSEALNLPEPPDVLKEVRKAVRSGTPYGTLVWRSTAMRRLPWSLHGRKRGRPATETHAIDRRKLF